MRQCRRFPRPHPIVLVWAVALFFTTIGNIALWKTLWGLVDLNSVRSVLFLASLPVVLFCLFNLMLTPLLALPFLRRPLLVLLVVVSAACSYFMLHYNVLIDRSMVQNVFETNQAELNAYLSLPLLLTLLALGVLPAAGLALVRTTSGAARYVRCWCGSQRSGVIAGTAGNRLRVLQGLLLAAAQQPLSP
ncbi:phosphoethanolamine transferase domain-containing protein [Stenotrophomonas maltophilia]|uniref:phosphoethanolamine transferase domain-containing protein n=1 Tax=Stenotrophomonas maltophilia TaxID=40324 RepID=UPI0030D5E6AC